MTEHITIRDYRPSDEAAVVALYCQCFAEPPWFERFDPVEVTAELRETMMYPDIVHMVAADGDQVVGVTLGYPIQQRADLVLLVPDSAANGFYCAELYVHSGYRCRGLAKQLVEARALAAAQRGFRSAVVRTSVDQNIIRNLYERLGFATVGTQWVTSTKFIDGEVVNVPDERVIIVGPLRAP